MSHPDADEGTWQAYKRELYRKHNHGGPDPSDKNKEAWRRYCYERNEARARVLRQDD